MEKYFDEKHISVNGLATTVCFNSKDKQLIWERINDILSVGYDELTVKQNKLLLDTLLNGGDCNDLSKNVATYKNTFVYRIVYGLIELKLFKGIRVDKSIGEDEKVDCEIVSALNIPPNMKAKIRDKFEKKKESLLINTIKFINGIPDNSEKKENSVQPLAKDKLSSPEFIKLSMENVINLQNICKECYSSYTESDDIMIELVESIIRKSNSYQNDINIFRKCIQSLDYFESCRDLFTNGKFPKNSFSSLNSQIRANIQTIYDNSYYMLRNFEQSTLDSYLEANKLDGKHDELIFKRLCVCLGLGMPKRMVESSLQYLSKPFLKKVEAGLAFSDEIDNIIRVGMMDCWKMRKNRTKKKKSMFRNPNWFESLSTELNFFLKQVKSSEYYELQKKILNVGSPLACNDRSMLSFIVTLPITPYIISGLAFTSDEEYDKTEYCGQLQQTYDFIKVCLFFFIK